MADASGGTDSLTTEVFVAWGEDLSPAVLVVVALLGVAMLSRLILDLRRVHRRRGLVMVTGVVALVMVAGIVLRPSRVVQHVVEVGAKVILLLDQSRRMQIEDGPESRAVRAQRVQERLISHFSGSQVEVMKFGGSNASHALAAQESGSGSDMGEQSDLTRVLARLAQLGSERASLLVLVSDGRLARPTAEASDQAFRLPEGLLGSRLFAVDVARGSPPDASIRSIQTTGRAVAHQALSLTVEVGCSGGLHCASLPLQIHELRHGVEPALLAQSLIPLNGQPSAKVTVSLTLERAGTRIVHFSIRTPPGDRVPANDSRILPVTVTRDRIRLLHVAGRPTYDVRALRTWLKSDASVDLVSFFILRTDSDDTHTTDDAELALIPFPVDELFTSHLPSFDAIILQDIDAERYRLSAHLGDLARYVEHGGGLLLVGGPSAFAGGGYAKSPLERLLPVSVVSSSRPFDTVDFVPRATEAGQSAALISPLRRLLGDQIPSMPGSNTLGASRPGAVVLWEHPTRTVLPVRGAPAGGAMPILAVSEVRDGRVVVLGVDGTYRLAFGETAVKAAGRAFGALWDGLLGWLMREPRFESLRGEMVAPCFAGEPATVRWYVPSGSTGSLRLTLERLGQVEPPTVEHVVKDAKAPAVEVPLGILQAGGYSLRAQLADSPPARFDFACETGGAAWADSRPDPERLERLTRLNQGQVVSFSNLDALPRPRPERRDVSRRVKAVLPVWTWALAGALALGAHWLARRSAGLS